MVLSRPEFADRFDIVLVMERGRLVEHGVRRAEKENRMSLEQEVEPHQASFIFAKIQPAMQKLLCFSAERLTFSAGQVMFKAGDMGDAAYVIIEGKVEISVPTPSGPMVNTVGRNDIIGEIAIFGDVPRTPPRRRSANSRRCEFRRSSSKRSSARTRTPRSSSFVFWPDASPTRPRSSPTTTR